MEKQNFLQRIMSNLKDRFGPVHYTAPVQKQTDDVDQFLKAISTLETGGVQGDRYKFAKPSGSKALGRDLGNYQITDGTLDTYGPRFLGGQKISGDEFLASSTAQDTYMKNMYKYYRQKGYTPQQIADIHRKGYKNSAAVGSAIYQAPEYVAKFNEYFNDN